MELFCKSQLKSCNRLSFLFSSTGWIESHNDFKLPVEKMFSSMAYPEFLRLDANNLQFSCFSLNAHKNYGDEGIPFTP